MLSKGNEITPLRLLTPRDPYISESAIRTGKGKPPHSIVCFVWNQVSVPASSVSFVHCREHHIIHCQSLSASEKNIEREEKVPADGTGHQW